MRDILCKNFQGTFVEPVTSGSMYAIKQQPDETLWQNFRRFSQTKAQVKGILKSSVIDATI